MSVQFPAVCQYDDATVVVKDVNSFYPWAHADGSKCAGGHARPKPQCMKCGAIDRLETVLGAWGDEVTCTSCGDYNFYSIGD